MKISPKNQPTLVVFTLGPQCESRRRQLLPEKLHPIENCLHQACFDVVLAAGRAAGCRLSVSSPLRLTLPSDVAYRPQEGTDFGSRIETAFNGAFTETDASVILVGSDTPDLGKDHLRDTLRALEKDPESVVIGPSLDGGFYLLAASRPLDVSLSKVRWLSRDTLESLKLALHQQGRTVVLLEPLSDLDQRADLEQWLSMILKSACGEKTWWSIRGYRLIRLLARLLAAGRRSEQRPAFVELRRLKTRSNLLRGPPAVALLPLV